ncbi:MAG: YopX family protein [Oscillospiraceae bacterium]
MEETRGLWRGKCVDSGEMVQGIKLYFPNNLYAIITTEPLGSGRIVLTGKYVVNPSTLGECTCGTDKTGKLAFEGDLVEDEFDVAIGVIRYGEYKQPFNDDKFTKHIGFYVDWIEGDDRDLLRVDLGYWLPLVKIIGNIHDNPEPLKGANNDNE